jgi:hypothetical protein
MADHAPTVGTIGVPTPPGTRSDYDKGDGASPVRIQFFEPDRGTAPENP